jgi:Raf kinase inhibitor-like YbhB/YbcL family protein
MKIISSILISMITIYVSVAFAETPTDAKPTSNMTLTTNAFLDKLAIPTLYTCDGKNVSPQLSWAEIPAKTATLAIIMKDVDAPKGTFYHWVLYNLPKSTTELPEGTSVPAGASIGKNNFDKAEYNGPCPPKGNAHTYVFTLYALDNKLQLPKNASAEDVLSAMKNHIIGQIELTGVYSRWIQ